MQRQAQGLPTMFTETTESSSGVLNYHPSLLLRTTNVAGYLFLILINVLSSVGLLGPTNADISSDFPTPLTPAGWAFSIWGIIFTLQGAATIYQALPQGYQESGWKRVIVNQIGFRWQLGWYYQCAWQLAFVQQSTIGMWACGFFLLSALFCFVSALRRLYHVESESRTHHAFPNLTPLAYILFLWPTSINAAWLSVASAVGWLIVPEAHGVKPQQLIWLAAILALTVSAGAAVALVRRADAAYGLTVLWALVALVGNHKTALIRWLGIACIVVLGLLTMFAFLRPHGRPREGLALMEPPGADEDDMVVVGEGEGDDDAQANQALLKDGKAASP